MNVLYLSSLCSITKYEEMFKKYGTTSSHASQKFNRLMVRGLKQNGYTVDALTQRIILDKRQVSLPASSECVDSVHYDYLPFYRNRFVNRILTIFNAFKFILRWSKTHPHGIIVCDIILGELSIAVLLVSKIRTIFTTAIVTDVPSVKANDRRRGIKSLPMKIKNSLIHSYQSYIFLTDKMNDLLNLKHRPYTVIEGLVDDTIDGAESFVENKHSSKVIMMAGSLEKVYGVDILLEAFQLIKCPDAQLHFYGRGSSINKIIEASKNDSRISFKGELPNAEIVKEEQKSTLLINPRPNLEEWVAYSFPSKNMEYIASGTPLVAFNLPCIPSEYLKHFYQLEEYTIDSIRTVLEELLKKDSGDLHKFGKDAQKWILESKCPQKQLEKFSEMLKKITI